MPMAATGPSPWLEARSLNNRHNTPRITVPAEATMGSIVARHAVRMAVNRSAVVCSSSRYRATSSSA